jgi:hypothetical protein
METTSASGLPEFGFSGSFIARDIGNDVEVVLAIPKAGGLLPEQRYNYSKWTEIKSIENHIANIYKNPCRRD